MYCGYRAYGTAALQEHFRMRHQDQTIGGIRPRNLSSEESPYSCHNCSEKFLTEEGLIDHCGKEHEGKIL